MGDNFIPPTKFLFARRNEFFLHTLSGFTVKNTAMRVLLDNYKSLIGSCLFQKQLLRGALQTKSFANFGKILINVFESIHFSV